MIEKLLNNPQIKDIADVFNKPGISHKEIEKAGAEFLCKCYEEKSSTSLNNLRQKIFVFVNLWFILYIFGAPGEGKSSMMSWADFVRFFICYICLSNKMKNVKKPYLAICLRSCFIMTRL